MVRNRIVSVYFTNRELKAMKIAAKKDSRALAPFIRLSALEKIKYKEPKEE